MELKQIIENLEKETQHMIEQWEENKLDDYSKGYCSALENVLKQLKGDNKMENKKTEFIKQIDQQ